MSGEKVNGTNNPPIPKFLKNEVNKRNQIQELYDNDIHIGINGGNEEDKPGDKVDLNNNQKADEANASDKKPPEKGSWFSKLFGWLIS